MAAFTRVNPGDPMQAHQLNQVIDALDGAVGAGVPIAVTAVNDATNYALAIQNDDATNSRALLVQKQDGTTLIQADINGVVLALANGSVHNAALATDVARANQLSNPGLEQWQRGSGAFTTTGLRSADSWLLNIAGTDTLSVSRNTAQQDSGSTACAAATFVLGTGAGASSLTNYLAQTDFSQLVGRPVSASIRVRTATASAAKISLFDGSVWRDGTVHSGSGTYETLTISNVTLLSGTGWYVGVRFTASCTAYIDNASLVVGAQAADYVPLHPADDLARCQRYYEVLGVGGTGSLIARGYQVAGDFLTATFSFKARKGVMPTMTKNGTWATSNAGQPAIAFIDLSEFCASTQATATGVVLCHNGSGPGTDYRAEANP